MITGVLLATALTGLVIGVLVGGRSPRAWLTATLAALAAGLAASVGVLAGGGTWDWRSAARLGGETLHLRLDAVSALFLALLGVVGGAGAVYAREYWTERRIRGRRGWPALVELTVLCLGLVLLSSNGLHFSSLGAVHACAYFLITLERARARCGAAGWLYLAASHVGASLPVRVFRACWRRAREAGNSAPMREPRGAGAVVLAGAVRVSA